MENLLTFTLVAACFSLVLLRTMRFRKRIQQYQDLQHRFRRSEREYKLLFEHNPHPAWIADKKSLRFLSANQMAMQAYGYSRQDFLSMTVFDMSLLEDVSRAWDYYRKNVRDSTEQSSSRTVGCWRNRKKDGEIIQVEVAWSQIVFRGKEAFLIQAIDVTKRLKAEARLKRSNERFELLAKATNDAVWDWDLKTGSLWWGPGIETCFGYRPDQIRHDLSWWTERLHPDDRNTVMESLDELIAKDGRFWSGEYRYQKADGTYAYVLDRGYVIRDDDNSPVRMVGTMLNITERKETEKIQNKMTRNLTDVNAELISVTQQLRRANQNLQRLVLLDPLTEVLNRRGLQQIIALTGAFEPEESQGTIALLLDIDDFKRFNSSFGHLVGDNVLKEITSRVKNVLHDGDALARIGGDEFLVLLPHVRLRAGILEAERIRLAVGQQPVNVTAGKAVRVTVSIGLIKIPGTVPTVDALLEQIHPLLNRSKETGKNRVTYRLQIRRSRLGHPAMTSVLDRLVRGNSFHTVAQPIYRLSDWQKEGYELLSRASIRGFEMPDDFFRACLEARILTSVDYQCFRRCALSSAALPDGLRYHINIFPTTFMSIPVWKLMEDLYGRFGKRKFCIEISEQQILGDPTQLMGPIEAFRQEGFLIAVDDVGFGHSCLESLVLLEPDIIKIDKKWTQSLHQDGQSIRPLERLMKLAGSLGADVVAEGIETEEDLKILKQLGVPCGQGFLLGKPKPVYEVTAAV